MNMIKHIFRITPTTINAVANNDATENTNTTVTTQHSEIQSVPLSGAVFENAVKRTENFNDNAPMQCNNTRHATNCCVSATTTTHKCATKNLKDATKCYNTQHQCKELKQAQEAEDCFGVLEQLNNIYKRRLQEIDAHAEGNIDLKLSTYKEWVQALRKVNIELVENSEELESEVAYYLKAQVEHNYELREMKQDKHAQYRNDINKLIILIQNAKKNDDWHIADMQFETITQQQLSNYTNNKEQ